MPLLINSNSVHANGIAAVVLSPLKQFKSGIASKDVKCNDDLLLTFKAADGYPACVKINTVQKLIERGWAVDFSSTNSVKSFDTFRMNISGNIFSFNYMISGGQLEGAKADMNSKSLIISIKTTSNGTLIVDLPRALIDTKIGNQDASFFVLADGQEIDHQEIKTTVTDRTLSIPFKDGTTKIEIIATEPT